MFVKLETASSVTEEVTFRRARQEEAVGCLMDAREGAEAVKPGQSPCLKMAKIRLIL